MSQEFVVYNGVQMIKGWPEKIEAAQIERTVRVDGRVCARIRYGDEKNFQGVQDAGCRDCGVVKGQLHVPMCDVERCPGCGDQLITCSCDVDDV
jgi:hypothetical protein